MKLKFKGTKGEWSCKKTKKGHYNISGDDWDDFCKVYTIIDGISDWRVVTQANAKLIASAPDLLEALQGFVNLKDLILPDSDVSIEYDREAQAVFFAIQKAQKAIEKALL